MHSQDSPEAEEGSVPKPTLPVTVARVIAAAGIASLLSVVAADAKTLYVDGATGNDATTYAANGPTAPWRTIGRAAWGSTNRNSPNSGQAAQAGDIVLIAAGTYSTTDAGDRFDVAYNPVNNGTSSSPIRFEGQGPVVLTYSSGNGPMIGCSSRNYIHWSGFTISESTAPTQSDTGPVTVFASTGCVIEQSTLTGNPAWYAREGDNYVGVRLEDATGTIVRNNYIRDYGGQTQGGGDENHAGIETYRSFPTTIENNLIENCGSGIYLKAVNTSSLAINDTIVRFNVFVNNRSGIRVHRYPQTPADPLLIYQNIFSNNDRGLAIVRYDGGVTDPKYVRVFNNTFVSNDYGFTIGFGNPPADNAGYLYWNNISYNNGVAMEAQTTNVAQTLEKDRLDAEHNLYFGGTFGDIGGNTLSLNTWKSTYGQDNAAPAAITSDPMFVNAAGGDYRLRAGSPAATLGRAVHGIGGGAGAAIPAGAYITGNEIIGLGGTNPTPPPPPPTPPPAAPTNLRITS
jgi:Right handed beta helix region